jgi:hypothetical protein
MRENFVIHFHRFATAVALKVTLKCSHGFPDAVPLLDTVEECS